MLIEDPPGFSIHESATVSDVWPMCRATRTSSVRSAQAARDADTVIPELAERWSWQDNYRNLVFFLRKNVQVARRQALHRART